MGVHRVPRNEVVETSCTENYSIVEAAKDGDTTGRTPVQVLVVYPPIAGKTYAIQLPDAAAVRELIATLRAAAANVWPWEKV